MKMVYRITSDEHGIFLLRRRKIAKAFRRWLREIVSQDPLKSSSASRQSASAVPCSPRAIRS